MNICDDPNRVSTAANWRENDVIRRYSGFRVCASSGLGFMVQVCALPWVLYPTTFALLACLTMC